MAHTLMKGLLKCCNYSIWHNQWHFWDFQPYF